MRILKGDIRNGSCHSKKNRKEKKTVVDDGARFDLYSNVLLLYK